MKTFYTIVATAITLSTCAPAFADYATEDYVQEQLNPIHGDIQELHGNVEDSDNWHNSQHDKQQVQIDNNTSEIKRNFAEHNDLKEATTKAQTTADAAQAGVAQNSERMTSVEAQQTDLDYQQRATQRVADDAQDAAAQALSDSAYARTSADGTAAGLKKTDKSVSDLKATTDQHGKALSDAKDKDDEQDGRLDKLTTGVNSANGTAQNALEKTEALGVQTTANTRAIRELSINAGGSGATEQQVQDSENRAVDRSNAYTDSRVRATERRLDDYRKESRGGIAAVAAMSSIPYVPGEKYSLGVGIGNFADATAVAVGTKIKTSEKSALQFSVGTDGHKQTVGAGFATSF